MSRRRESAAVGVLVGGGFLRRGDLWGEAVGDCGTDDEERERVMRGCWARVVQVVVVMARCTLGLLGAAVVLHILRPWDGILPMPLVEGSCLSSRASSSLFDGLTGVLVDPAAILFVRRKRFSLP